MEHHSPPILNFILIVLFVCGVGIVFVRSVFQGIRGNPLRRCSRYGCRAANAEGARFCKRCGNALQP